MLNLTEIKKDQIFFAIFVEESPSNEMSEIIESDQLSIIKKNITNGLYTFSEKDHEVIEDSVIKNLVKKGLRQESTIVREIDSAVKDFNISKIEAILFSEYVLSNI